MYVEKSIDYLQESPEGFFIGDFSSPRQKLDSLIIDSPFSLVSWQRIVPSFCAPIVVSESNEARGRSKITIEPGEHDPGAERLRG